MVKRKPSLQNHFYGSTVLGEKGQIVIPKEARNNMGLKKGDHLLVFSMHNGMLALVNLEHVEEITSQFAQIVKYRQTKK